MIANIPKLLALFLICLPVGFGLTSLVFAVTNTPISAAPILTWALSLAAIACTIVANCDDRQEG